MYSLLYIMSDASAVEEGLDVIDLTFFFLELPVTMSSVTRGLGFTLLSQCDIFLYLFIFLLFSYFSRGGGIDGLVGCGVDVDPGPNGG